MLTLKRNERNSPEGKRLKRSRVSVAENFFMPDLKKLKKTNRRQEVGVDQTNSIVYVYHVKLPLN